MTHDRKALPDVPDTAFVARIVRRFDDLIPIDDPDRDAMLDLVADGARSRIAPPPADPVGGERDWLEDYGRDEATQRLSCLACGSVFVGLPSRHSCKLCVVNTHPATPPEVTEAIEDALGDVLAEAGSLENCGDDRMSRHERDVLRRNFRDALDRYTAANAATPVAPVRVTQDARRLDALEALARAPGGVLLHDERAPTGRVGIGLMSWSARPRTLREAIDDATQSTSRPPRARAAAVEYSGAPLDLDAIERQFAKDQEPVRDARAEGRA